MAKIKFNDDDAGSNVDAAAPKLKLNNKSSSSKETAIDSSSGSDSDFSDDDDEAPEEENLSSSAKQISEFEKMQKDALLESENLLKAKRKAKTLKFQEQQKLKQERLKFEKEQLLEFEKQLKLKESEDKSVFGSSADDILNEEAMEELPEDFLANLESTEENSKPKHRTFDDADNFDNTESMNDDYAENAQEVRKAKQNTLKMLRRTQVQKGSFIISRNPSSQSKSLAPRVEKKVLSVRDKWLKRKSLNKK